VSTGAAVSLEPVSAGASVGAAASVPAGAAEPDVLSSSLPQLVANKASAASEAKT
jgi:hypothetical protein